MKRALCFLFILALPIGLVAAQTATKKPAKELPEKAAPGPQLTVDAVIQLYTNDISEEVITAKIKQANHPLELSADDILKLKKAKVPDRIILMLMDPSLGVKPPESKAESESAALSPAPIASAEAMAPVAQRDFIVQQSGQQLKVEPKPLSVSFIKSKEQTTGRMLNSTVMNAALDLTARTAAQIASAHGGGSVLGIGTEGLIAWATRARGQKGFLLEYLPGKSAMLALPNGQVPIEFALPTEQFPDGSYHAAELVLVKARISEKNQIRVLTSERVEIKMQEGDITERKTLGTKEINISALEVKREAGLIRATITQPIPPGEYAIVFRHGDRLLPQAFEFRIAP